MAKAGRSIQNPNHTESSRRSSLEDELRRIYEAHGRVYDPQELRRRRAQHQRDPVQDDRRRPRPIRQWYTLQDVDAHIAGVRGQTDQNQSRMTESLTEGQTDLNSVQDTNERTWSQTNETVLEEMAIEDAYIQSCPIVTPVQIKKPSTKFEWQF